MADVHNKKTRSYNMSMIRSRDTKPEIMGSEFLFANGLGIKYMTKLCLSSRILIKLYFLIWVGDTYSQFLKLVVELTQSEY